MKKLPALLAIPCVLLALAALPSCSRKDKDTTPVVVASMIDSEGAILGNMIVLLLKEAKIPVVDRTEFGTPEILRKALMAKELDLVVDYTGSGQYYHEGQDPAVWSDPKGGYEKTRELDAAVGISWLEPAPANNTEMLAMRRSFAEEQGLKSMKDFAAWVNSGASVKLICAQSFADNPLGLKGYEAAYGFTLKADQLVLLSTGNTAEMLKALAEGTNGVNVSLVYGTDGALENLGLMVLEDPESVPPVYLPAPVIRTEVLKRHPEIAAILKPAFTSLDLRTLQRLNAQVAFSGLPAEEVALAHLRSLWLLEN